MVHRVLIDTLRVFWHYEYSQHEHYQRRKYWQCLRHPAEINPRDTWKYNREHPQKRIPTYREPESIGSKDRTTTYCEYSKYLQYKPEMPRVHEVPTVFFWNTPFALLPSIESICEKVRFERTPQVSAPKLRGLA